MVRALLDGRKTQTRRVLANLRRFGPVTEFGLSDTAGYQWHFRDKGMRWHDLRHAELLKVLRWEIGYRLYVCERVWLPEGVDNPNGHVTYHADHGDDSALKWRPGIHMPRWASRLTLTVTDVRVQRLQEISKADCIAEGIEQYGRFFGLPDTDWDDAELTAVAAYRRVWDRVNGDDSWVANPWIVALTFTVERRNIDHV
jgi:hypothetical protein